MSVPRTTEYLPRGFEWIYIKTAPQVFAWKLGIVIPARAGI
jgi:hypothetical protein